MSMTRDHRFVMIGRVCGAVLTQVAPSKQPLVRRLLERLQQAYAEDAREQFQAGVARGALGGDATAMTFR